MIAVIQRVSEASVTINQELTSKIGQGLMVLLGIENEDENSDIQWLSKKILNLRIFDDEEGVMNKSLIELDAEILLISQFTLHASTRKGNRPSYIKAARPEIAIPIYEKFIKTFNEQVTEPIKTGEFGADMKVSLINDGPVTIIIDTKNKV
jgi:D-aminoacyl-tRNA deacylase